MFIIELISTANDTSLTKFYILSFRKNGQSPRINFDTLSNSLIAAVLIFYNVEWDGILYDYMRGTTKFISIFIAIVVIIGEIFLMKIFMALFVNKLLTSENVKIMFRLKNDWGASWRRFKDRFLSLIGRYRKVDIFSFKYKPQTVALLTGDKYIYKYIRE